MCNTLACDLCKKIGFASPQSLSNHKSRCKKRKRLNDDENTHSSSPASKPQPKRNAKHNDTKRMMKTILETIQKINSTTGKLFFFAQPDLIVLF
jgi:hypothetical protein